MLTKKLLKTARTVYIYGDGHAVIVHQKRDRDVGTLEFVTMHETLGIKVQGIRLKHPLAVPGRLIVSEGAIHMLPHLVGISWSDFHVENGSPNTKARDIRVASIRLNFTEGYEGSTRIHLLDGLSADWHPQCEPAYDTTWEETAKNAYRWGTMLVASVYRAEASAKAA